MGVNDTLEQLRAAQAYAVELEADVAKWQEHALDADARVIPGLAAVIEQALRRSNFMDDTTAGTWAGMVAEVRGILASADTDAALRERDRAHRAEGWDAAVAAIQFDDGTPVELVAVVNPYREGL